MKVKELIKLLQELPPEHQELEVISSADDEGNSYHKVSYDPEIRYVPKEEINGNYIQGALCENDCEYCAEEEEISVKKFKKNCIKMVLI